MKLAYKGRPIELGGADDARYFFNMEGVAEWARFKLHQMSPGAMDD